MMKPACIIIACMIAELCTGSVPAGADTGGCFIRHFGYHADDGPVALHSDIDDKFTRDHARHARLVWDCYQKTFSRSPGRRIVLYYTKNQDLYDAILKKYPAIVMKGARQVTTNWTGDHREWFIMPYAVPDYSTQLHEISHDFLYFTCPAMDGCPWFKEGSAMYYESGAFNAEGELAIERPLPSYHALFKDLTAKKQVIPLATLLRMPKNDFYRADYTKTYSQSMLYFFYLAKIHPGTMNKLFMEINDQKINGNEWLVNFIVRSTGKSIAEMEREYIEYGTGER